MQRKNFYLSTIEIRLLNEEAGRLDISTSDLLRRIIDEYFKNGLQTESNYIYYSDNQNQNLIVSGNSW